MLSHYTLSIISIGTFLMVGTFNIAPMEKEPTRQKETPAKDSKKLHDVTGLSELIALLSVPESSSLLTERVNGLLPIHTAARNNRRAIVSYFIEKSDPFEKEVNDMFNLSTKNSGIKAKSRKPISVDQPDSEGRTPLFHAVEGGALDVVKLLLAEKARTDRRDNQQRTVLHVVTRGDILKALLANKRAAKALLPLLNSTDGNGNIPLSNAAANNRDDVFAVLVRYGARVDLDNHAFVQAVKRIFPVLENSNSTTNNSNRLLSGILLNDMSMAKKALADASSNAQATQSNSLGRFTLGLQNRITNSSPVERLVNNETLGIMPLVAAFQQGNMHIAALLIRNGAAFGPEVRDAAGRTLADIAAGNAPLLAFYNKVRGYNENDRIAYLDTVISNYEAVRLMSALRITSTSPKDLHSAKESK